jgi:hypothetical protein
LGKSTHDGEKIQAISTLLAGMIIAKKAPEVVLFFEARLIEQVRVSPIVGGSGLTKLPQTRR